jgi:hypothetical protein
MAITKEVTFVSVIEGSEVFNQKLLFGTVNLIIKRDAVDLINQNFTANYEARADLTIDQRLARWSANILAQMQAVVDQYVREQALKTNAKLATVVTGIQTNLNISGVT